jgi:tetratricopeptide (TPR) repeat protein
MTHGVNGCWTRALLVFLLSGGLAPLIAADDGDGAPLKLKVGAGTQQNQLKVVPFVEDLQEQAATVITDQAEPRRLGQVLPAEPLPHQSAADAQRGAVAAQEQREPAAAVRRLPATTISGESEFQPRFRKPDVHHAEHLEPLHDGETNAATWQAEGSRAERPAFARATAAASDTTDDHSADPATGATAPGKPLIEEAYAKSKQASTDTDYTEIIDLCGRAADAGLRTIHKQYAKQLTSWAYNRRGEARVAERRDKEALADFEAAAELNPDSWRAIHNRGVSYAALGRSTGALADFDRTIELHPKYANAYFNRGEVLATQGRFEEAIRDYQAAIDLGPADAAMFNSLGHAYYQSERIGDALREYGRALELEPGYAQALVNRGDAYKSVSRYGEAAADYRAAIEADPQMGRAYQAAAWLMATCPDRNYRNEQLAIEAAQKAVALDGPDSRNLETLAAAQASAALFDQAKETQEKAIALVPRDELVAAEKRMALYQRDLAYREVSQQQMVAENQARTEAEAQRRRFPVRQAGAEVPDGPQHDVVYPEAQPDYRQQPMTEPPSRSFWSRLNPFDRSQQQPPRQPRNLPRRPTRQPLQPGARPW